MSTYTHQAAATRAFGIEFRSKLEAEWAYWLTEMSVEWTYADSPWHDFLITSGGADMPLEIKPQDGRFLRDALDRIPGEPTFQACVIACGSPTKSSPVLTVCCSMPDGWKLCWKLNLKDLPIVGAAWTWCCILMDGAVAYRNGWFHAFNWHDVPFATGYSTDEKTSPDCRPLLELLRTARRQVAFVGGDFSI